jgi:CubicO group peptidase (beta-lactamase class C family)
VTRHLRAALLPAVSALSLYALQPLKAAQNPILPKAIERVDALVGTELASDNIGGITIGIVSGGQLVWTKSYGYADVARTKPLARHNVFAIASITKQFTALMLLQLVERGTVRLSDPVDRYLPEVRMLRPGLLATTPSITLAQLATHTSGLDRNGDDDQNLYGVGPPSQWESKLLATIPVTRFIHEPGARYSYSNVGYAILAAALARAAGVPYVEYVQDRILKPLGMSQTTFVLDQRMEANRARGFLIEDGKVDAEEPERQVRDGRGWRVPSGGLYSTVDDLARFVAFELGAEAAGVLSQKTLQDNLQRVGSAYSDFSYGYGIGFQVRRRGNLVALGHDGVIAGYHSSTWIDPKTRLGMIVLTTKQEKFLGLRALEVLADANR